MRPKSVVLRSQKKLQVHEKNIFEKKTISAYLRRLIFKMVCGIFFNKFVSRYLSFGYFKVPKSCSSQ